LEEFLKKQVRLESLSLQILQTPDTKADYEQQNDSLINIIQNFEDNKCLRHLTLRSKTFSLEAFSKGFGGLKMENQLQSFTFEGSDDTVTSQQKTKKRVEGLCHFIKYQKASLKTLEVILSCALEEDIANYLAEAISYLYNLKSLHFFANYNQAKRLDHLVEYLQNLPFPKRKHVQLIRSNYWNPRLGKCFKDLESLEYLELTFDIPDCDSVRWFEGLIKRLPDLKQLKKIKLDTWSIRKLDNEDSHTKIVDFIKELEIKGIEFEPHW